MRLAPLVVSLLVSAAVVAGLELYASYKLRDVGWNYRGYRGRLLSSKDPNEILVATIGGSTTYGYTVMTADSYPALTCPPSTIQVL